MMNIIRGIVLRMEGSLLEMLWVKGCHNYIILLIISQCYTASRSKKRVCSFTADEKYIKLDKCPNGESIHISE